MKGTPQTSTRTNGMHRRAQGDRPEPHALANELTDDERVQASSAPMAAADRSPQPQPRDQALTHAQRSIGKWMGGLLALIVIVGFIIAAALTNNWLLLGPAVLVFIPFMIFLLLPVWLASTTKISQDHAASARSDRPDTPTPPSPAGQPPVPHAMPHQPKR